jgi:hypothetical protein
MVVRGGHQVEHGLWVGLHESEEWVPVLLPLLSWRQFLLIIILLEHYVWVAVVFVLGLLQLNWLHHSNSLLCVNELSLKLPYLRVKYALACVYCTAHSYLTASLLVFRYIVHFPNETLVFLQWFIICECSPDIIIVSNWLILRLAGLALPASCLVVAWTPQVELPPFIVIRNVQVLHSLLIACMRRLQYSVLHLFIHLLGIFLSLMSRVILSPLNQFLIELLSLLVHDLLLHVQWLDELKEVDLLS